MRLYLPATALDLLEGAGSISGLASAVTEGLRQALPSEDLEGLEMSAYLTAADLSLLRLAREDAPPRRIVLAVELGEPVAVAANSIPDDLAHLPSLIGSVEAHRGDVVALHVDAHETEPLVRRAMADDDVAEAELADEDLLWFDPSEWDEVVRMLTTSPGELAE